MNRPLALLLASVTAACLAACSDEAALTGDADEGGQNPPLSFQVAGDPEETAVYASIAAAYNETGPATPVEVVEVPSKDDHLALLQPRV